MPLFSDRYGYTKPSDVLIRERITPEIQNAICTCYDDLQELFINSRAYRFANFGYEQLELHIWIEFLKERRNKFFTGSICGAGYRIVATDYIENNDKEWYEKLNLIDFTIEYLRAIDSKYDRSFSVSTSFVNELNAAFKRLFFAYRVVNDMVVEITAEEEIKEIEEAIKTSSDNIKMHLRTALELYGKRPNADFRNSIKESISAVEAYCRERTGTNTLGEALKKIESSGVVFPQILKTSFEKLYAYTNQPDTGIRHALMDDDGNYTPKAEEAAFMLVTCSAFINYLRKK